MAKDDLVKAGEQVVKKRGRGGKENFPNVIPSDTKAEDIKRILKDCLMFYDMPIVSSDEECRDRHAWFFDACGETGQLPTVEKMIMALGAVKSTVWNWENGIGCSSERMNLIKKAKEFIASFESAMVTEGKINPVVYIFRAKNYFGMKDQQDITIRPDNPYGDQRDAATIAKEYDALPEE